MKKVFTILTVAMCISVANGQSLHQKDPFVKTFVQDAKKRSDPQVQNDMRDAAAWANFLEDHGSWWVEFNEQTGKPHRAFGAPIITTGTTPVDQALNFITTELKGFNPEVSNLVLLNATTSDKYHYVTFKQQYSGLDILWSEATVRLSLDGKVVMFGLDTYSGISTSTTPLISNEGIESFATQEITTTINQVEVTPELKILPIPGNEKMEFKLVYEVNVHTTGNDNIPGNYYTLVDANTGYVYYRKNQVHACGAPVMTADVQVNSVITDNPLLPEVSRGLPYIRVEVDGDFYYADANGFLTFNSITEPTPATVDLRGLYAKVSEGALAAGTNVESVDITINPGFNTIEFDDASGATASEVSAYYWQNVAHDHLKSYFPTYTGLDLAQLIRVERTDGTCNAFWDGSSINFYADGAGCPATALFNDVVIHEYGHGINSALYQWLGLPFGMNNGAMHEAYADVWAITITDNPIVAQGFFGGAGSYIRRYDLSPKVYPDDIIGEVHADGEIIAGAWWDVNENFGFDLVEMTELFMASQYGAPDGPDGTEGVIFSDVLIEALLADDDNADLNDGTPRMDLITTAFCEHGISLITQVSSEHQGITTYVNPDEPVAIEIELDLDYPSFIGEIQMTYKLNNDPAWTDVPMTLVTGSIFKADLPAQPEGTVIGYYVHFSDINSCGGEIIFPYEADISDANLPFYALVGYNLQHSEDFDNVFGSWEVDPFGDDDAEFGVWEIDEPIPSFDDFGNMVQTNEDHTTGFGNLCAFTENAAVGEGVGSRDVDKGKTTLRSPIMDLTIYEDPVLIYWRKYSNDSPTSANQGNDHWQVYISDNNLIWVEVERTRTADNTWRRNAINVKDYVDITETVSLIFIAQDSIIDGADLDGGSLVEAAIDDMEIWDTKIVDTTFQSIEEPSIISGVFPNPANETVNIFFSNIIGEVEISVSNAVGEIVLTQKISVAGNSTYSFNSSNFAQGIYTLSAKSENNVSNKQIIIQH